MGKRKKVWLLCVHHKHGENNYVHATYKGTADSLYEYVKESWGDAQEAYAYHNPKADTPLLLPEDKDEAIETYFDLQGDTGDEWYECEEYEVGP